MSYVLVVLRTKWQGYTNLHQACSGLHQEQRMQRSSPAWGFFRPKMFSAEKFPAENFSAKNFFGRKILGRKSFQSKNFSAENLAVRIAEGGNNGVPGGQGPPQSVRRLSVRGYLPPGAVSYTHLTLPTTPYV